MMHHALKDNSIALMTSLFRHFLFIEKNIVMGHGTREDQGHGTSGDQGRLVAANWNHFKSC